jgi:hypothetical protein
MNTAWEQYCWVFTSEGETHEFKIMYPAMIQDAAAEKMMDARHSLEKVDTNFTCRSRLPR